MRFQPASVPTLLCAVFSLSGCQRHTDIPPPEPVLYPVTGKVTAAGKPLAHAVVTFLQVDETGTTSIGETDEAGVYELSYVTKPGTAPRAPACPSLTG
jgi:hypothetical protein